MSPLENFLCFVVEGMVLIPTGWPSEIPLICETTCEHAISHDKVAREDIDGEAKERVRVRVRVNGRYM
jgi:hypothetical protein